VLSTDTAMTMASPAAFVGRRVLVTRRLTLQPADLIVLAVVVGFVLPVASDLLRVQDPRTIIVLAICWTCAALKRLTEWRIGQRHQRQIVQDGPGRVAASVIVFAGAAPWIVLPLLQQHYPHASLWAPIGLPVWLRAGGAALLLYGVIRPFLAALRTDRPNIATVARPAAVGSATPGMLLDGLGFGLLAASPLLGALIAIWLVLTCPVNSLLGWPSAVRKVVDLENKVFPAMDNSSSSAVFRPRTIS
jgi:hypothetical protein